MPYEITLTGANFVSEERRRAFEKSLAKSRLAVAVADRSDASSGEVPVAQASLRAADGSEATVTTAAPGVLNDGMDHGSVLEGLERGLAQSYDHQSETLRVHQHYLSNEAAYAAIFAQLVQEQGKLFAGTQTAAAQSDLVLTVFQTLGESIAQFHNHQSQTLTVHSQFLEQQAAYARSYVDLLQRHYGAVLQGNGHTVGIGAAVRSEDIPGNGNGNGNGKGSVHSGSATGGNGHTPQSHAVSRPGPVPVLPPVARAVTPAPFADAGPEARLASTPAQALAPATAEFADLDALAASLLTIVSEKTGYPAEMLDLGMDMEADLGIDSIKRVEILGALEEAYPDLPSIAPEALAELRTLGQVIEATGDRLGEPVTAQATLEAAPTAAAPPVLRADPAPVTAEASRVARDLLAIVSEKTGYPAEMLDLSMDMEADLGIDSIKRVEIMGALQEMHSGLGEIEAEALAELRTLASILDHVASATGTAPTEADSSKKA